MFNKDEIDQLLLKYLLQETTETEKQDIEQWISSHPEHKNYFMQFRQIHIRMQSALRHENIRGNYTALIQKIHHRSLFRKISRIAAVVILLLGSSFCFYLIQKEETTTPTLAENTIQPGSSHAILHLSSGESVQINAESQELQEKDGTTIRISDEGMLNYKESHQPHTADLMNRLEIPRGGEFKISLADGTEVWLNSETELKYPTSFSASERSVYLKGEAYFKVAKDEKCPFIVHVDDIQIKVYGTQFNINTQNKDKIETVLVNGSVSISHQGQETFLKPDQKAAYSTGQLTIEEVNTLPYIAWKDGNFMFQNEPLVSIMEKLARWYDLQVFYLHDDVKNIRLSGMLERYKDVNELFHHFEKISKARFTTKGRTVTIE